VNLLFVVKYCSLIGLDCCDFFVLIDSVRILVVTAANHVSTVDIGRKCC